MEKPEDKRLLLRFPPALADQLTEMAEKERRSLNAQIVYLLERAVERYQRRRELDQEESEEIDSPALAAA